MCSSDLYILMMAATKAGWDTFGAWPKKDIQAHIAFMTGFSKALSESGELVATEGLAGPDQAKVVRAGKGRAPITDGVFLAPQGLRQPPIPPIRRVPC